MTGIPQRLFERLFGDGGEHPGRPVDPRLAAGLAEAMDVDGDAPEMSVADLAAHLDGGLEGEAKERTEAALAGSGQAFRDLASAAGFLEDVSERRIPAPADLVQAAASSVRKGSARPERRWRGPKLAWGFAAAVAIGLAALLVVSRMSGPADPKAPLTATPAPDPSAKPAMVPAGNMDTVRSPGGKPGMAPEGMEAVPGGGGRR